jgi:hypothetical protein
MRWMIAVAGVAALAACSESGNETGRAADDRTAVDTVITERTVQDTTVIRTDTTVRVDTSVNRGDGSVGARDTVRNTRTGQTGAATTPATPMDTARPR